MPEDTTPAPQPEAAVAPNRTGSAAATESPAAEPSAGSERAGADAAAADAARLQRERDEYYDLLLRTRAEFDNYRKRVDRERLEVAESAAADLLRDLLPIVDDLERALAAPADSGGAETYRRGVELIHRQLLELLRQYGVTPIEALGAPFDPHQHQAVLHEVVPGRREGEVIEEYRRGYMLGRRLLRPSMVKVAAGE
ncbi:MAG TPA: nucleotide exchange factor GrpE [Vicinamibacterales bacterium]|nr:nucleotide exchange factor GrpE [Vicinamibacterales bacterium]